MSFFTKLKTISNLLILNLKIFYQRFLLKKKIIIFYYPKSKQINENIFYIENLLNFVHGNKKIYFLHQNNTFKKKNYYLITESKLNFLLNVNLFISNFICDNFPKKSQNIYIHHNLYDDPWVNRHKEKETCIRLTKYNYIFTASTEAKKATIDMFKKNLIQCPRIIEVGYHKLDYLLKKKVSKKNLKDSILIAPTLISGFKEFSISTKLNLIIQKLLIGTKYNIILRPHPRDRNNLIYKKINYKFKNEKRFEFNISSNYLNAYFRSKILITDISGTAYTYVFLTLSPVIFFSISESKINKYKYSKLSFFKNRNKIGLVINSINDLIKKISTIEKNYKNYRKKTLLLRKKLKYLNKSKYIIKGFINNLILKKIR